MPTYCYMAGGVDPPAPLRLLKLDLDGFSQAEPKLTRIQPPTLPLLLVMLPRDDILRMFWEIEGNPKDHTNLSPEEHIVVQHFKENHSRSESGRFIVPLPKILKASNWVNRGHKHQKVPLRSLYAFQEFATVMNEYFELEHAEPVPPNDLRKPPSETFHLMPCARSIVPRLSLMHLPSPQTAQ